MSFPRASFTRAKVWKAGWCPQPVPAGNPDELQSGYVWFRIRASEGRWSPGSAMNRRSQSDGPRQEPFHGNAVSDMAPRNAHAPDRTSGPGSSCHANDSCHATAGDQPRSLAPSRRPALTRPWPWPDGLAHLVYLVPAEETTIVSRNPLEARGPPRVVAPRRTVVGQMVAQSS
jgi:hypothetical protein